MIKKILSIITLVLALTSCSKDINPVYRERMRNFVIDLSSWSRSEKTGFIIIPQNGHDIFSTTEEPDGSLAKEYSDAVDGAGQEDLYYGYNGDNIATPSEDNSWIRGFLDLAKSGGNTILVTDYCSDSVKMADSYKSNEAKGYISFAAPSRELDEIPDYPINNSNNDSINSLSDVKNFLYLINPVKFGEDVDSFTTALSLTNYDLFIIDFFVGDNIALTKSDLAKFQLKPNGAKRLVVAYMSIGEAEDYRYYWKSDWKVGNPSWITGENPDWPGNYKVEYWNRDWQNLIFGSDDSYLGKIINAGFDGAYLDIIEAFEYYENE